jgi:hypothetical protein
MTMLRFKLKKTSTAVSIYHNAENLFFTSTDPGDHVGLFHHFGSIVSIIVTRLHPLL